MLVGGPGRSKSISMMGARPSDFDDIAAIGRGNYKGMGMAFDDDADNLDQNAPHLSSSRNSDSSSSIVNMDQFLDEEEDEFEDAEEHTTKHLSAENQMKQLSTEIITDCE